MHPAELPPSCAEQRITPAEAEVHPAKGEGCGRRCYGDTA